MPCHQNGHHYSLDSVSFKPHLDSNLPWSLGAPIPSPRANYSIWSIWTSWRNTMMILRANPLNLMAPWSFLWCHPQDKLPTLTPTDGKNKFIFPWEFKLSILPNFRKESTTGIWTFCYSCVCYLLLYLCVLKITKTWVDKEEERTNL